LVVVFLFSMMMTPLWGFAINCFKIEEHSSRQPVLAVRFIGP